MAVALRQSRSFSASSPVTRYWVANCVGFTVTGGAHGTVEAVLAEGDPHSPETLLVRTSKHRIRQVAASAVISVVPSRQLLVVRSRPSPFRVQGRAAILLTAAAARTGGRVTARLCVVAARASHRGWIVASPVVAAWSHRAARESWRLVRSVPWCRYGRFALSVTTKASQELWRRSSRLRTTWSRPSNANDSSGEASTTSST